MAQQRKRRPRRTTRFLNMLLLIFAFLVVFEGRLIINIASRGGIHNQVQEQLDEIFSSSDFRQEEASAESETSSETAKDSTTVPKNITPFAEDSAFLLQMPMRSQGSADRDERFLFFRCSFYRRFQSRGFPYAVRHYTGYIPDWYRYEFF